MFDITPTANKVKLHDSQGHTKAWTKDGTQLIVRDITSTTGYYTSVAVTINSIYLTSDTNKTDIKGTPNTMKEYAGDYAFKINVANEGRIASTDPDTVAKLNAMATTPLDLTMKVNGSTGAVTLEGSTFYASVKGDDNKHSDADGVTPEKATFSVTVATGSGS